MGAHTHTHLHIGGARVIQLQTSRNACTRRVFIHAHSTRRLLRAMRAMRARCLCDVCVCICVCLPTYLPTLHTLAAFVHVARCPLAVRNYRTVNCVRQSQPHTHTQHPKTSVYLALAISMMRSLATTTSAPTQRAHTHIHRRNYSHKFHKIHTLTPPERA